ncbi:MAG: RloB domain-containing protein [Flavobacteriaceae bacterium]
MNEPWKIKEDDSREEDTLITYIIFCEDKVSEPVYFKFFETSRIKINLIPNQKSSFDNVVRAISYCRKEGIVSEEEGEDWSLPEDFNVWCVFDRDKNIDEAQNVRSNIEFDEAIAHAKRRGIKVAWSNDAFELWVLLHFEAVKVTDVSIVNRITYYNRLTEVFRNIDTPSEKLQKAISHQTFGYKSDLKREKNFRSIVREKMIPLTSTAINRAKELEDHFNSLQIASHQKSPLTLVHHLVEELISLGGRIEINTN